MPRKFYTLRFAAALISILNFAGCDKKSGEAVVLGKEHIAAREIPETSSPSPTSTPQATPDDEYKPIGADEITVDQYVMNPAVRGTSRDPRATDDEQWLVKVRMIADGRQFNIHADRLQWEKLKDGDRIKVRYRLGKYTKTVWDAEITR